MTATIAARIQAVRVGHSARALIHAVDSEGLEYKLEVPADAVQRTAPGQVLVLHWSIHALPDPVAQAAEVRPQAAEVTAQTTASPDRQSVDQAFMDLMAGGRRGAPRSDQASAPFTASVGPSDDHDIDAEFNILLGGARRQG